MISVRWDPTLAPALSPEQEEIKSWDDWFALVGLSEEWSKIKQACKDTNLSHRQTIRWAEITELTRLDELKEQSKK